VPTSVVKATCGNCNLRRKSKEVAALQSVTEADLLWAGGGCGAGELVVGCKTTPFGVVRRYTSSVR
jgi:hypothetical protein